MCVLMGFICVFVERLLTRICKKKIFFVEKNRFLCYYYSEVKKCRTLKIFLKQSKM